MKSSWLLAFDTATPQITLALGTISSDGETWFNGNELSPNPHQASQELVPAMEALLQKAGISWSDIDHLACGVGPGTFTGTRVAVATAKGIAVARNIPLFPVSTLLAVAANGKEVEPAVAVLDARKNEVYAALASWHDNSSENLGQSATLRPVIVSELLCAPLDEVCQRWESQASCLIGPGIAPYRPLISNPDHWRMVLCPGPSTHGLWKAACAAVHRGRPIDPSELSVEYLRASYAELGMNFQKRPRFQSPFAKPKF